MIESGKKYLRRNVGQLVLIGVALAFGIIELNLQVDLSHVSKLSQYANVYFSLLMKTGRLGIN